MGTFREVVCYTSHDQTVARSQHFARDNIFFCPLQRKNISFKL
jgi:hypothetical protein